MTALRAIIRRVFRGRAFTGLLERCGIEPRRYWVLVELFDTLSDRQEISMMGNAYSMSRLVIFWFILSGLMSLVVVFAAPSPLDFLLLFVMITVFQLSMILVADIAESLLNPVAGLILAHQPVNGATWSGAKLTHLLKVVVYVVTGMNGIPALVGLFLSHTGAYPALVYPALHFLVALGVGVVVALLWCSLFGWLVRFIPIRRLKAAAVTVQAVPMALIFGFIYLDEPAAELVTWATSIAPPDAWLTAGEAIPGGFPALLGVGGVALATAGGVFGLRALSRDHLIRVSGLMRSGAGIRRRQWKRSKVLPWVARLTGGQAGRAGFEYLRAMMVRDWQFRRNMALNAAAPVVFFILLIVGRELSPFDPGFAPMHFLPHLLGATIIITCAFLAFGNDYKGIWSFGVVPDASLRPFVRGIHAALWLMLVALPNIFWLLVLAWSWDVTDAVFFTVYNTVVASLYLGVGLRLIDGVPFGRQTPPDRTALTQGFELILAVVVVIAVGIQFVIFRSVAAVAVLTCVVGLGAYVLTRLTLADLAARIRSHLNPAAPGPLSRRAHARPTRQASSGGPAHR